MTKLKLPASKLKINKLFLIGNGFDLALNLKTSYNDFLLWLLKKNFNEALNSEIFTAPFEKYPGSYNEFMRENSNRKVFGFKENNLFDILLNANRDFSNIDSVNNIRELLDFLDKRSVEIVPSIQNGLITDLLKMCKVGWVDVEGVYFDLLKLIIKGNKLKPNHNMLNKIDALNEELSFLILELKNYLQELETKISKDKAKRYIEQFAADLTKNEFSFLHDNLEDIDLGHRYFLNFNYTDSLTNLLSNSKEIKYNQNFIHGNLQDNENSIIFGFGDEMDSVYKEMEELNDNRFFKHIKSFQYFKTPNYRELLSFLNSGDYQVCIYGHSCGLSDRIMLNEIFEHENCKSIKIYYYNDEDFTNKTMEISRHFNSNQLMRKKIVEKSKNDLIPQVKDMDNI
ncbi:Bacteriophage abortive infection AbiH [Flavobacterium aquidurense]|uniref:Bacteriophage abortive infection AbiH n=1 Tax=Flavobacterium frigidimaris TaxID=262320 RepID=A0ABX4BWU9_FLAFR|nr:AbiH family protein [Flavobacterium frigidimaris]OXA82538.1 hypothetical protein B0A65_00625 [Flavobacterium frigidimaris]SDZ47202.1 Bacteriophage abortive infection AbiH [Flavobacterium aquidurense]